MTEDASPLAVPTSVKARRKLRKWTQADLASAVDLSITAIHNLEAGKNGFTDKTLAALAKAFGCRPADLLLDLNEEEAPIVGDENIQAVLKRITGLKEQNITALLQVINGFLQANAAPPAQSPPGAQSEPASPRHV